MSIKTQNVLKPIKKTIYLVIAAIVTILILLTVHQQSVIYSQNETKVLINVISLQQLYTQKISKDATRLFALLQADEEYRNSDYGLDVSERLEEAKRDLAASRDEFRLYLHSLEDGFIYIKDDYIKVNTSVDGVDELLLKINRSWDEFSSAVDVLVSSEYHGDETSEAIVHINDNNLILLSACEQLMSLLQEASESKIYRAATITYTSVGILFAIILVALFRLWKFLIHPLSRLYKGMEQIGLKNVPLKSELPTDNKRMSLVSDINEMFLKIEYLISLIESMNNNASTMEILKFMNQSFSSIIPYNYIGIALVDEEHKNLRASYGVSDGTITGLPDRMLGLTWQVSDTSLGMLLESGKARIINDLEAYVQGKHPKLYNRILLESGIKASITLPLKVSGIPVGMIFFSSSRKNVYQEEHVRFLKTLANSMAISLNQNLFISDVLYSGIFALAKLAEARDEDTGNHLERMKLYSRMIASLLYENELYKDVVTLEFIDEIERFSPLHDIGKVGIRDEILLKPGKLTPEEYEEMKKHTQFGGEVLRAAENNMLKKGKSLFRLGIEIAEGHHEKWDGSGYPKGIKGEDIPISARIVAVADVFDAVSSRRPYKEPFPFDTCVQIIEEGRGKHFDPVIVDVFMNNIEEIRDLYESFHLM